MPDHGSAIPTCPKRVGPRARRGCGRARVAVECDTSSSLVASDSLWLGCTYLTDLPTGDDRRSGRHARRTSPWWGASRPRALTFIPLSFACLRSTVLAELARKPSAMRVVITASQSKCPDSTFNACSVKYDQNGRKRGGNPLEAETKGKPQKDQQTNTHTRT